MRGLKYYMEEHLDKKLLGKVNVQHLAAADEFSEIKTKKD